MLFTQPLFLIFFAAVFLMHWGISRNAYRKALLLVASYVFYAAWDWRFLFLIAASTLVDYLVGPAMAAVESNRLRRRLLVASLLVNLGILGTFKYYDFFVHSAGTLLEFLGIPSSDWTLHLILPVGISFFTFQSMSYSIDVYRRQIVPVRNLIDFALFVGFFPKLVAGPIVRASEFLPQLKETRHIAMVAFKSAIALFLVGFFKKAVVADNIAPYVDAAFEMPGDYTGVALWLAVLLYAVQIYCDFSGYTDMARAVAQLLGYDLVLNFKFPYFASNIREFWRRWHISLSTWLRDYLYIPLGGSHGTTLFTLRNLMLTMLLGGLWHGASWNFIVWGGLHGVALIVHRYVIEPLPATNILRKVGRFFGVPLTFGWVCFTWVFFRASTLADSMAVLKGLAFLNSDGTQTLPVALAGMLIALVVLHGYCARKPIEERIVLLPDPLCAVTFAAATCLIFLFVRMEYQPFIYFQF